jgi:hypothetical protein
MCTAGAMMVVVIGNDQASAGRGDVRADAAVVVHRQGHRF